MSFRLLYTMSFRAQPRNLPGFASDTLCTTPRSVRSSASTLREKVSKSLKHRTRVRGGRARANLLSRSAGYFNHSLAQNCSICAKEEPQEQKADKANSFALLQNAPCGDEEKSPRLPFRPSPTALYFAEAKSTGRVGGADLSS